MFCAVELDERGPVCVQVWCDREPGRKSMNTCRKSMNTCLDGVREFFDPFDKSVIGLQPQMEVTSPEQLSRGVLVVTLFWILLR